LKKFPILILFVQWKADNSFFIQTFEKIFKGQYSYLPYLEKRTFLPFTFLPTPSAVKIGSSMTNKLNKEIAKSSPTSVSFAKKKNRPAHFGS